MVAGINNNACTFRFAALLLFIAALLTLAKELLGQPIKCGSLQHGHKGDKVLEQFCWIRGTRSLHPPFVVREERHRTAEALPGIRAPSMMEMDCKFNPTQSYREREVLQLAYVLYSSLQLH